MNKIHLLIFKLLAVIVPLSLIADSLRLIPENPGLLRGMLYVMAPLIIVIIFGYRRKKLDRTAQILGWLNVAYVVYVVIMLSFVAFLSSQF